MITRRTVSHYKSFDARPELNLISSRKIRSHPDHKVRIKQTSLLKYAAVYGANASGKSNLVDVLSFIRKGLENGMPVEASHDFCRNRRENETSPSVFEVQFTAGQAVDGLARRPLDHIRLRMPLPAAEGHH
jgi:AAA15 family ATPase/GTPase